VSPKAAAKPNIPLTLRIIRLTLSHSHVGRFGGGNGTLAVGSYVAGGGFDLGWVGLNSMFKFLMVNFSELAL